MKFKNYLTEKRRSQDIDESAVLKLLKTKCKKIVKHYLKSENYIYRGISANRKYLSIEPSQYERVSTDTFNIYTLYIDNAKEWKNFPKRSKSIICTTSFDLANSYGNVYVVFPFDGAKIGVCPKDDIWISFKRIKKKAKRADAFLEDVFDYMRVVSKYTIKYGDFARSWPDFLKITKKIDVLGPEYNNKPHTYDEFVEKYGKWFRRKSFIEFIGHYISPDGFEVKKAGDKLPPNREVWTDSKSILIKSSVVDDILEKLR